MQPLLVKDIRQILQGKLIMGSENWMVRDAIHYKRHKITKQNTLIFVSRNDVIHWVEISRKAPVLVISDKPVEELKTGLPNITIIQVRSQVQANWKFINYYRSLFTIPVVTITGTCGKTTTKDMLTHVLKHKYTVQASISSQNEPRRSLPYLMGIDKKTDVAVFEHGLGNTGNIKHQCMIYQPTIGILTNIGVHHLDGCKNLDGYIKAKAEIVEGIRKGGTLIINADDENTKKISLQNFEGKIITFGINERADYSASHILFSKDGMKFRLHFENRTYHAFVPGVGEHQVSNALATLAAANEIGLDLKDAIARLASYQNMARHLEFAKGPKGSTIIDDTWTNNPTSVEAALKVLDSIGKGKKIILILGDINRLGAYEKKYHREIGSLVADRKIHTLVTIGKLSDEIAKQALIDGSFAAMHHFNKLDADHVRKLLDPELDRDTIVLIKGPMSSRAMIALANQLKEQG